MHRIYLIVSILALTLLGCNSEVRSSLNQPSKVLPNNHPEMEKIPVHYLALGDSYTIGESVPSYGRFPEQLADSLRGNGFKVDEVNIIARTGWTTDELQKAITKEKLPRDTFDLVTLLIGVNNQYRGYPIEQFNKEFTALLSQAIQFAGGNTDRVFVLSIPDYGVTPFAANRSPQKIGREIDQYNSMKAQITDQNEVTYLDITEISRLAAQDTSLIAGDKLHPSERMYQLWVRELLPKVLDELQP